MNAKFVLEVQNGNWSIVAAGLGLVCLIYYIHETIALRVWGWDWRSRLTPGMRNAIALGTLSLGVCIRSTAIYLWRAGGGDINDLSETWILIGGIVAVVGFLCTIREISRPLYGNAPWLWTLAVMVLFTVAVVGFRIF